MSNVINIKHGKLIGIKTSVFTIFNQDKYDPKAIPTAWQDFFAKARGTELANTTTFYGASIPSMSMDAPMDYFAGALVSLDTEVPDGFESVVRDLACNKALNRDSFIEGYGVVKETT